MASDQISDDDAARSYIRDWVPDHVKDFIAADLAARVEAERVALRRVLAKIGTEDDHYSTPTMDRLEARGRKNAVREIHEAIRALGPTPAFDAAIKAAREDGMEVAVKIAQADDRAYQGYVGCNPALIVPRIIAAIRAAKDQPA